MLPRPWPRSGVPWAPRADGDCSPAAILKETERLLTAAEQATRTT
jgi:hypothetical protein